MWVPNLTRQGKNHWGSRSQLQTKQKSARANHAVAARIPQRYCQGLARGRCLHACARSVPLICCLACWRVQAYKPVAGD